MNIGRVKLRGCRLMRDCNKAKVVHEFGGIVVCGGLHKEKGSFFLSDYDVIDDCRKCGAWHINWSEKQMSKSASTRKETNENRD